jgi:ATP-binding cassette subfamily G (WHITE) protein 2 (SNQ2)
VPCPKKANPAEHIVKVVSRSLSKGKDWNKVWLESTGDEKMVKELDSVISDAASKGHSTFDDGSEFAASMWEQIRIVSHRMNVFLSWNTEYINKKLILHILLALLNGFTCLKIADDLNGLRLKFFTLFSFILVAPGLISQL